MGPGRERRMCSGRGSKASGRGEGGCRGGQVAPAVHSVTTTILLKTLGIHTGLFKECTTIKCLVNMFLGCFALQPFLFAAVTMQISPSLDQ